MAESREAAFGRLLKYWRRERGKSQLGLALDANVSQKHLSLVEVGRASPSRELVLDLAAALAVPLREQNELLAAAGYAPVYAETAWESLETRAEGHAVLLLLKNHEPLPAVALDRHWRVLAANGPARRLVSMFAAEPPAGEANLLRLMFDPEGLRPAIANWEEVARMLIGRVHREALGGRDDGPARELLAELLEFPDVPRDWARPRLDGTTAPIFPTTFGEGAAALSFFSAVTTLGTAQDITLQELRIEFFLPADEETRTRCESLLVGTTTGSR